MTDYTELKRLAEAISQKDIADPIESKRVMLVEPAAVLALIAENEQLAKTADGWDRLNIQNKALSDSFRAERDQLRAEVAGLRTGYEAYEQVVQGLKAEVEALSKALAMAASRMADAKACFDRDFPGEWSGELHLAVGIKEIDAAMSKGEQS